MKHSIVPFVCLAILALVAIASIIWLWFMIFKPEQWSRLVDKENDFWVGKGIVSPSLSGWFRRFEKGLGQKILVGIAAAMGIGGFIFVSISFWHLTHK